MKLLSVRVETIIFIGFALPQIIVPEKPIKKICEVNTVDNSAILYGT